MDGSVHAHRCFSYSNNRQALSHFVILAFTVSSTESTIRSGPDKYFVPAWNQLQASPRYVLVQPLRHCCL